MSRLATPIRKNDNVVVTTGKDRGKRGRVLKVEAADNRLVIEGESQGEGPGVGEEGKDGETEGDANRLS